MCNAFVAGAAIQGGGTLLNMFGNKQAAKAQAGQYDYMADMSTQQATEARMAGRRAIAQHNATVKKIIGAQKAAAAGSGTDVNTGSNVDLIAESARGGAVDAMAIKYNADSEEKRFRNQSRMYRAAAKNTRKTGSLAAGTSLLTSAGQFADRYYSYKYARG